MFRELDLNWNGDEKRIKPTMDLLRYLEQRDVGPHLIANLIASRKVAPGTLSTFVAAVLQYAGYKVNDEQVYEHASTEAGFEHLMSTAVTFAVAMIPQTAIKVEKPAKKPQAPRKPQKAKAQ